MAVAETAAVRVRGVDEPRLVFQPELPALPDDQEGRRHTESATAVAAGTIAHEKHYFAAAHPAVVTS